MENKKYHTVRTVAKITSLRYYLQNLVYFSFVVDVTVSDKEENGQHQFQIRPKDQTSVALWLSCSKTLLTYLVLQSVDIGRT